MIEIFQFLWGKKSCFCLCSPGTITRVLTNEVLELTHWFSGPIVCLGSCTSAFFGWVRWMDLNKWWNSTSRLSKCPQLGKGILGLGLYGGRETKRSLKTLFIYSFTYSPIWLSINQMFNIGLELRERKGMQDIDLDYYHKGTEVDIKIPEYIVREQSSFNVSKNHKNLTSLRHPVTANETSWQRYRTFWVF